MWLQLAPRCPRQLEYRHFPLPFRGRFVGQLAALFWWKPFPDWAASSALLHCLLYSVDWG